ncbi:hypothetical protein [Turneriella parva]|uniref:Uncharacterized protein n=1 Tax=Turneriella parva (strain ATCC BAA-1111 / DSM 21527 / NCTC 11395 / H) TaxID=869212 RepID=I4B2V7_TURPD|nr:hypothetical protein [Turneriella parva]AFM11614.1 hypothetical protein Turpa_0965 [Turneriella parva DSM 21527]
MRLIAALTSALLTCGLAAQDKPLPVLQYVDGHGNSYEFTQDGSTYVLDFAPVKKDMKSRKYDGGEPATRRLSKDRFDTVLARMDEAIKKKRLARSRDRGTALIIKESKGDFKEYILPEGSKDIKEIEALLYTLF